MRLALIFFVIAAFMVKENYAYAVSMSCVWINGKQECTNNVNNGNGNAATAMNAGGYGNSVSCVWINGKQECTNGMNNGNGNAAMGGYGNFVSCVWINGKQECTNGMNNGNGNPATVINTGGQNSGVPAGSMPNSNFINPFQLLNLPQPPKY